MKAKQSWELRASWMNGRDRQHVADQIAQLKLSEALTLTRDKAEVDSLIRMLYNMGH